MGYSKEIYEKALEIKAGQVKAASNNYEAGLSTIRQNSPEFCDIEVSLAKAGSGDVLAGLVGALIAQKSAPLPIASALAVYLHAAAGDSLATELSTYGVTPSDLPREIAARIAALQKYVKSRGKLDK